MQYIIELLNTIITIKSYILLPSIIFLIAIIFSVKISVAFKSALYIGVGLIGISILFSFFVESVTPVMDLFLNQVNKDLKMIDVGWPVIASLIWTFNIALLTIPIALVINMIMLIFRLTNTFNVDIWNFWHIALVGVVGAELTGDFRIGIVLIIITTILLLKLADWSVPFLQQYYMTDNINTTTLTSLAYLPYAVICNNIIEKIPFVKNINFSYSNKNKNKYKYFLDPGIMALIIGLLLGIIANYPIESTIDFAIRISAVFLILPKIVTFIQEGFLPISEGITKLIEKKISKGTKIYIGVNHMILLNDPIVITSSLILMPFFILISILFEGINVVPLGDLTNIIGVILILVGVVRGNIFRIIILSIPVLLINLFLSSYMAPVYTNLLKKSKMSLNVSENTFITSSLNGGEPTSIWLIKLFEGNKLALFITPIVIFSLYYTYLSFKKRKVV